MKNKKSLKIFIFVLIIIGILYSSYKYHIYQKTALQVSDIKSNGTKSIWLHGKKSIELQDIFLQNVTYLKEQPDDFSKEEERWNWTVVYYPRSFRQYGLKKDLTKNYDELLLNFKFYDDKIKKRMVVFGNISGGENRYGYIKGNDYLYLRNLLQE